MALGKLHPSHQHNKAPFSQWPVLHFWFLHFFQHGPFDRWEVRLLCSADLHFRVEWLAKKVYFFFPEYIQEKTHTPFLSKCIIVDILPLFMCFKGELNLPPEICFL